MRSLAAAAVFLILGCVLSLGQALPDLQAPKKARISGLVIAADTSQPLARVKVTLVAQGSDDAVSRTVTTGADGSFDFSDLDAGGYTLSAERTGYMKVHGRSRSLIGERLTLAPGEESNDLVVRLVAGGAITGRIVDEEGDPLQNIRVAALQYRYPMGRRVLQPAGWATTNDLGEYRIFGLAPGKYCVSATHNRRVVGGSGTIAAATRDVVYPPMYYPDSPTRADAAMLEVKPGSEQRADFHLSEVRAVTVRGRLLNPSGADDTREQVILAGESGVVSQTELKPDRTFLLRDVVPGSYMLVAMSYPDKSEPRVARQNVTVGPEGLEGVELSLDALGALNGRIRAEGPPVEVERLSVTLVSRDREGGIADAMSGLGGRGGSARVGKDGTFTMPLTSTGLFDVVMYANGPGFQDWYTKAIYLGNRDVMTSGIQVSGKTAGTLEIQLAANGALIEGTVVDGKGKPASDATVVAVPEPPFRQRYELYQPAHTDHSGHFVIRGQRPGDYKVYAWDEVTDQEYFDPDFVKQYENDGTSLHAEVNGHHQLALKVLAVKDAAD